MKRSVLFIALLACGLFSMAQDTTLLSGPKPNYLNHCCWPVRPGDTIWESGSYCRVAFYRYTEDTMTIYGIAASAEPEDYYPDYHDFEDTTLTKVSATLRLYKRTPYNSIHQIGEDLELWVANPPTYYMMMDAVREIGYMSYIPNPVYPVYELYFSSPVRVTDSFYVGMDQYLTDGPMEHRAVALQGFYRNNGQVSFSIPEIGYMYGLWTGDTNFSNWHYYPRYYGGHPFLFPILTPKPDTVMIASDTLLVIGDTIVVRDTLIMGGDTVYVNGDTIVSDLDTIVRYDTIVNAPLALREDGLLSRLTGVQPNPAAETVRVLSGCGMTMVEAFSLSGDRIATLRLPEATMTATIDVSRWPAGTYLLRIRTPMGTALKKLTVTR